MYEPNSNLPSDNTVDFVRNAVPALKDMIGDITKSVVHICRRDIQAQTTGTAPDWYKPAVTPDEGRSILRYIEDMAAERTVKSSADITVDHGIALIDEFLAVANNVKADLRKGKLDAERCKYFIRSGHTILNYFDDLLAKSA